MTIAANTTSGDGIEADEFLLHAIVLYDFDILPDPARWQQAADWLEEQPGLVDDNPWALAAAGATTGLEELLDRAPELLDQPGGPRNWPPLLWACYARIPGHPTTDVVHSLLARGADANAFFIANDCYRFTALTGVFGRGENGPWRQAAHPDALVLARALLEAGADPADGQATYNRMFTNDDDCLELLLQFGLSAEAPNNWNDQPGDEANDHASSLLHYQFIWALRNHLETRARLLLQHGVDASRAAPLPPHANLQQQIVDPWKLAITTGQTRLAEDLLQYGAGTSPLSPLESLLASCCSGDTTAVEKIIAEQPDLPAALKQHFPGILHSFAQNTATTHCERLQGVIDALALCTYPVDSAAGGTTALHQACWHGNQTMVETLIRAGADSTLRDTSHWVPPLGWALHRGDPQMVEIMEQQAVDIFTATVRRLDTRLAAMLNKDSSLANITFGAMRRRSWQLLNPTVLNTTEAGSPQSDSDAATPPETLPHDWMTPLAMALINGLTQQAAIILPFAEPLTGKAAEQLISQVEAQADAQTLALAHQAVN